MSKYLLPIFFTYAPTNESPHMIGIDPVIYSYKIIIIKLFNRTFM
ncbi:hypothetical protein Barb6XT_03025 [Bacteroidales bacterium Barb6XT]|nr:hypothetical protein Barb6XT_03025 [Bacteroidales bacterium Barb6XT]